MGILSGSASITRYHVVGTPEEPEFEASPFQALPQGSEVRERIGFVPFELGAPYQVGHRRFAFRVRIDRLKPDATAVRERLRELMRSELEMTGASFLGPKKRRHLRHLAEEEILVHTSPQSRILEGVIDGDLLYVGTTANAHLGTVLLQLRQIGVVAEPKAPWIDLGEPETYSDVVETRDATQSVLGCRFLKGLVGDREVMVEPESGQVRLQTREAKVALSGAVLPELHRYLEREGAELLSAKLVTEGASFRLDALSWRLGGLTIETARHEHWTDQLDERLEKIAAVFDLLDRKYAEGRRPVREPAARAG